MGNFSPTGASARLNAARFNCPSPALRAAVIASPMIGRLCAFSSTRFAHPPSVWPIVGLTPSDFKISRLTFFDALGLISLAIEPVSAGTAPPNPAPMPICFAFSSAKSPLKTGLSAPLAPPPSAPTPTRPARLAAAGNLDAMARFMGLATLPMVRYPSNPDSPDAARRFW